LKNRTSLKDFLWFSVIAITILVFISIPNWVAHSAETDNLLFRGAYFDEVDYSVHISMMQAGRMGDWAYEMRFTSEAHQPAFLRMFYIVLGHISKWVNLSVEKTYLFALWFFGFIALYSIYQLCLKVFREKKLALIAFLLCTIGGGAGWLQLIFNSMATQTIVPIDFSLIDAYVFFSISVFPSFSFTLALMAVSLTLYLDYLSTGKWLLVVIVGLLALLSQITNPIAFAVIDIAFAGATFCLWWKNKEIKLHQFYALAIIACAQIPLFAYSFLILERDPFWSQFTFQNQTPSPAPSYYVWGFAPFWLTAIYGMVLAFREKNVDMVAMSAWIISGFILAYLPLGIQRRFLLGITIPLGIVAIYGLNYVIKLISIKLPLILKYDRFVYFTYILFSSFSLINLCLGSSLYIKTLPEDKFYPRDLENALIWLDNNAAPNDFVLGNIRTGQLIAQRTRLKAYVGHPMETLFFDSKTAAVEAYYRGETPNGWIEQTPIQWVVYSLYEKEFTPTFIPEPDLELVYQNDTVQIYKVKH
jgi:hypothetical protein